MAEIALPGTILFVKFLLKLLVDKSVTLVDATLATIAFPVDVIFLALSLNAGFIISHPSKAHDGVVQFCAFLGLAVLSVFLWRRSDSCFLNKKKLTHTVVIATLNFALSFVALWCSIAQLSGGVAP